MFAARVAEGVLRLARPGTRWLVTDHDGGYRTADAAYNVSVPEGFDRTDLAAYVRERRERAGFPDAGPALLTGVSLAHARGARSGPVEAVATVGLSNPAALPMAPDGAPSDTTDGGRVGTVNLLVGTTRALPDGGLATLLATAVEAKTATLTATTCFSGTTSDGVVVGTDPDGDTAAFAGSATPVGAATRACVREAVRASLASRYADCSVPTSVADADHGVVTDREATVFEVGATTATDRET
jgi:adenosylcobinamide hydrolase